MKTEIKTTSIWFYSPPLDKNLIQHIASSLEDSLKEYDIQLRHSDDLGAFSGMGIILLKEVSDDIYPLLAHIREKGNRRLMVLLPEDYSPDAKCIWQLLQSGASDVLIWQDDISLCDQIKARFQRWQEIDQTIDSPLIKNNLVGKNRKWRSALQQMIEAAKFTQEPVLLIGETGTGKELAARLIHTLDKERKEHNLVIVDCTNINRELSGSELFGHERGAFTGAVTARDGAFATADGGSIFLDEIGELPPELQVQLLRVLQEHKYRRVGSNVWRDTNFRLICATNRNLKTDMKSGKFRSDLYYRIATWTIELPPLDERDDDIPLLARHFLEEASNGEVPPVIHEQVEQYLCLRSYPGNVRELENLVYRIYARYPGTGIITLGDIPHDEWQTYRKNAFSPSKDSIKESMEVFIKRLPDIEWRNLLHMFRYIVFQTALDRAGGSPKEAASLLKVDVRSVQKWRKEYHQFLELFGYSKLEHTNKNKS